MLAEANSVKINHLNSLVNPNQTHQRGDPQGPRADRATGTSPASSGVDASQVRQQPVDTSQDIDTAKVEEIRSAIRNGELEIHADRIAEGLLANNGED